MITLDIIKCSGNIQQCTSLQTFELALRLWVVTTGVLLLLLSVAVAVTSVRSLVDFRYRSETMLSEHVLSNVE